MNLDQQVYLDYAATTPMDDRVVAAMLPYFSEVYGNPSSIHFFGQRAEAALETARETIAEVLNAKPEEIVFTSGGTESDNLAVRGAAFARRAKTGANHILTTPVEHDAILHTVEQLGREFQFDVETLPVDANGWVDPEDVKRRLRADTVLVSVIYANNEIGTINALAEIGAVCRAQGVWLHSDAVQAAAHLEIDVEKEQIDLLSIGAHKMYGPKGVGALYIRSGIHLMPMQTGGGQEAETRAGTQNVAYIVGLAAAVKLAALEREQRAEHERSLRDQIIGRVLDTIPGAHLTGHFSNRLPNHASFVFENVDGNHLVMLLDAAGFACSSGSACKVGNPKPSNVLQAIGVQAEWLLDSLRVTVGKDTLEADVERFLAVLPGIIERARRLR